MPLVQVSKRALVWSVAVVGGLLLALIVAVVVLTATLSHQAEEAKYRACMERLGSASTAGGVSDYAQRMADAAAACSEG